MALTVDLDHRQDKMGGNTSYINKDLRKKHSSHTTTKRGKNTAHIRADRGS
jgi:hypothetical protein